MLGGRFCRRSDCAITLVGRSIAAWAKNYAGIGMLDSYPHNISLVTGMRETEALLEPSNQRRFVRAAVAHKSCAELLQAGLDCDPRVAAGCIHPSTRRCLQLADLIISDPCNYCRGLLRRDRNERLTHIRDSRQTRAGHRSVECVPAPRQEPRFGFRRNQPQRRIHKAHGSCARSPSRS